MAKKKKPALPILTLPTDGGRLFQIVATPETLQDCRQFAVNSEGQEVLILLTDTPTGISSGIQTEYGKLVGTYYYTETAARYLWKYFQDSFDSDEPFPEDRIKLVDHPASERYWQTHSTPRKLFEYAET